MEQKTSIVKLCKELGCCDACCLRYIGLKYTDIYENPQKSLLKYQEQPVTAKDDPKTDQKIETSVENYTKISEVSTETSEKSTRASEESTTASEENTRASEDITMASEDSTKTEESTRAPEVETESTWNTEVEGNGSASPPAKRKRLDICSSCLGVLQQSSWPECFEMVKEQIEKKRYSSKTFGCGLSSPMVVMLREKAITLHLKEAIPSYDAKSLTPLKEAWKWSFGTELSARLGMALDSGAVSPLLITVSVEYPDELQELEILKTLSPSLFASRSKQRRRFTVEFTRRSVEQALSGVSLGSLRGVPGWDTLPAVRTHLKCVSVVCTHSPVYLGGRYLKLSRSLPQTPWLVNGQRMMESSVQEIIFQPIARLYGMSAEDSEHRLKFMSAGREDVDVRCLGDGRPFAIEVSDPNRQLTSPELEEACEEISRSGKVSVTLLRHVTKDDLTLLKQGEETKTKMYEALCIKLSHAKDRDDPSGPITVTPADITTVNTFRNTGEGEPGRVRVSQRTPIRVLHRRPLLTRTRLIYDLEGSLVPGHPQLFTIKVTTQAGTYVKEWVHGSLGRTRPSLAHALAANIDILALDVTAVHLKWPPTS